MNRTTLLIVLVSLTLPLFAADPWQPNPKLSDAAEKRGRGGVYREEKVPQYTLPDPLLRPDGTRVATAKEWEADQRQRTLDLFASHVYGRTPPMPARISFDILNTQPQHMEGKATLKRIKITAADDAGKSFSFEAALLTPNAAKAPVPAFVFINNRPLSSADPSRNDKNGFWPAEEIIARGYATAVFRTGDVDPDKKGDEARAQGVRGVWPAGAGKVGEDAWATIGAWAWGASRVLDYLATDKAIDAKQVAVIGHSRGGKTALWCAAQDMRFALAISSCSGEGGASIARRRFGETTAAINTAFPYWFCDNYKKYNDKENDMPVDQHQLVALIAPRAVAIGSADEDLWADPRGEFLSLAHAAPVFALYNLPTLAPTEMPALNAPVNRGQLHYHVRPGIHNLTPEDWNAYMDFADSLWRKPSPK